MLLILSSKREGILAPNFKSFLYLLVFLFSFSSNAFGEITPYQIENKIKEQLTERVKLDYINIPISKIDISFLDKLEFLPPKITNFKITIKSNDKYVGNISIPVTFYDSNNNILDKIFIQTKISVYSTVFKTKKVIDKGKVLKLQDIFPSQISIRSKPNNLIFNINNIIGKETKFTIGKETTLVKSMISAIPDIRRNDKITIIYNNNNLELKLKGLALNNGSVGEKIKVKSFFRNKIFEGEIIDSKYVAVNLN
jgi:flagellar basal body P-ring formation protein FlgA